MYKNIKWTEIITQESQITKTSALYIIPLDDATCKLIYVDDNGERRTISMSGGGGASRFIELIDAPFTYLNNANRFLKVNSSETGLEFTDVTPGQNGKSAYEIAVDNGFVGTEVQWLLSLKGSTGPAGKSAYQVALDNGFVGTEAQWLESLNGEPGEQGTDGMSAYQIAVNGGFVGTEAQWLASLNGDDGVNGLSAYEVALSEGFIGTESEWLNSLNGQPGTNGIDGISAYQIALNDGFVGTEAEWLASLKGDPGEPGEMTVIDFQVDNNMHLIMQLETTLDIDFTLVDGYLIVNN